jgi:hypothetical protein
MLKHSEDVSRFIIESIVHNVHQEVGVMDVLQHGKGPLLTMGTGIREQGTGNSIKRVSMPATGNIVLCRTELCFCYLCHLGR